MPNENGLRAIGYVRVSTEEQATYGVSLDAQRQRIESFCEVHQMEVSCLYSDEGRSAGRADNRPGLAKAIEATCRQKIPLVVYSLSRLARSTRDAIEIVERINGAGADLVSITERIDTTTGMGRFFFTTMAALAQLERDLISERTTAALAYKRSRGERVSRHPPYGHTWSADGKRLVRNRREQQVLATIHRLRREGLSSRQIIAELDRLDIGPRTGASKWHPKVILDICQRADL